MVDGLSPIAPFEALDSLRVDGRGQSAHTRGGTDAPICQDTHSGSVCDVSTSAEVCHDALVDLAREETFEAPDDLTFGAAVGRTSHNVVDRWLVVPHADDGCLRRSLLIGRLLGGSRSHRKVLRRWHLQGDEP